VRFHEFEHVIRAAADVVEDDIVVVGSQAVLAQHPDASEILLQSLEVDVFPRNDRARTAEIDGALGDGSRFHETYGYYAHAVGPEALIAPAGWDQRLVRLEVPAVLSSGGTVTAWCLEVHDLVLAKLAAGRPHDLEFAAEAIRTDLVEVERLRRGLELMAESHSDLTAARLETAIARATR
jgi:hypothetical protein